jgi:hypothetical protein
MQGTLALDVNDGILNATSLVMTETITADFERPAEGKDGRERATVEQHETDLFPLGRLKDQSQATAKLFRL